MFYIQNIDFLPVAATLKEKKPSLFSALGMSKSDLAKHIQEEATSVLSRNPERLNEDYLSTISPHFESYISILELATASLGKLALTADVRATLDGLPVFWHELEASGFQPPPSAVIFSLATALAKNLYAIRLLVLTGLNSQAVSLARTHFESLSITLASAVDESIFEKYVKGPEQGVTEFSHWNDLKRAVRDAIKNYYEQHHRDEKELIIKSIIMNYDYLSQHVHAYFPTVILSTHCKNVERPIRKEASFSLGGTACHESKATLFNACADTCIFLIAFEELLFSKHGWNNLGEEGSETLMTDALMESFIILFFSHYSEMANEVLEFIELERERIRG